MTRLPRWTTLVALLATIGCARPDAGAAPAAPPTLSSAELAEGWIMLFDGRTLFGWKASADGWTVAGGAIQASGEQPSFLSTTSPWADFQLKLEYRAAKDANSGVFLRAAAVPKQEAAATDYYEVNIAPASDPFPTGSLVGRQQAEAVADADGWQSLDVLAEGGQITVRIGSKQVLDYTDPKPLARGAVALQHNAGDVAFRNIKLRPLGLKSIFNGKDLSGWKTYPELKTRASVTPEGALNLKDGKGQVETAAEYGDFTLQLECYVNGKGLNSGVFFRCIPGETMNGYESQIHNGTRGGDREKPADCGTGGIFRRIDARRVVADDFQWFHKTIHAAGSHVAVWVNGYQVTDWTDDRKPDSNPRKGLRLEPGTIQLQGHDPTTDLSFRNLRIAELPQ